ncbi:hypothetical protein JKP88DRAFT_244389 [Tribonema minus]|uniref:Uncharacterized protein n=1 Tax=Tribonema minus TaxID=303371 RepID=A0A835Z2L0_9STRA|nr:hypothetical protein JKP88DRAFT_244389 [Tribonema minus]
MQPPPLQLSQQRSAWSNNSCSWEAGARHQQRKHCRCCLQQLRMVLVVAMPARQPQQLQQQYQQAAAAAPAQAPHARGRAAAAAAAAAAVQAKPAAAKRAAKTTRASKKRQRQVEQEEEEEDQERHFALSAAIPALNGNGAAAAAAAAAAGAFAYPRQLSAARGFGPGGAPPVLNPYRRAADAAGANPGASPGGSANGAAAAAAEARRGGGGGGGGAQEVKEERDVNMWAPRDEEREALHWLLQMGFQSDEAVMGIRSVKERAAAAAAAGATAGDGGGSGGGGGDDGGHDSDDERAANGAAQLIHGVRKAGMCDEETAGVVQQASRWLLRQRSIRWHSQQEDQTRLMRDHDLEHAAAMRAQSELALEAEGDILGAPLFASSTLLAEPADARGTFAVHAVCSTYRLACHCSERYIHQCRWPSRSIVECAGGCAVLRRLLAAMEAGELAPSCAMAALRESAVRLLLMEMRTQKCPNPNPNVQACADALTEELKSLEAIHARYPGTSMDVPREFRECAPRSTLEDDGIEEVELEAPSTGDAAAAQQAEGTAVAAAPPPPEIIELE